MKAMKKVIFISILWLTLFSTAAIPGSGDLEIRNLKCEDRVRPFGVDVVRPTFGWELISSRRGEYQRSFQIRVARSGESLQAGNADIWDSGKIDSSRNSFIPYEGKKLDPGTEYFWRVRVWGGDGRETAWSDAASFVTGLGENDWDGARWIAYENFPDSLKLYPGVHGLGDGLGKVALKRVVVPLFRREFDSRGTVKKALVFVTGLGQYELRLNGEKVGDGFLSPGWTDYRKSCLYNIHDVTGAMKKGRNAIAAVVGNGFFNINRERYRKLVIAYGAPMLILKLQLEFDSGAREVVVSGPDWKTQVSPITFSSIYGGEDYDARLEQPGWDAPFFDDSPWKTAVCVAGPGGRLVPEKDASLKVMQEIGNPKLSEPKKGIRVYDFGQNASGIIHLKVRGRRGQQVRIIPGELLGKDSCISQKASGEPFYFQYTMKGEQEEEWTPRFTYYGFRYAQVEGALPTDLKLLHIRNSTPTAGTFACSNKLFNRIFNLILWSIKSNLASVPTDCPHREKLGWLEQTHLMGGAIHYNFDILNLYRKLVQDMSEAQLENGLVPDIAPEYVPFEGGFRDSPEWGSACIIVPWALGKWYGDRNEMEKAYPMMKRYIAYLQTRAEGHILSYGLGDWFDLGPNPPGPSQLTPIALTATATYYHDLILMADMARRLNRVRDADRYRRLAVEVKDAFNRKFFDRRTRTYAAGSQTAYAMPLCFGMVEVPFRKEVFANLVRSIRRGGNALTAGDIGFHYLVKALEEGGESELLFAMNCRSDMPGYGYQLARGATSLTESWPAREDVSNNHMMLGHLMEWFYSGLAGIRQADDSFGYEKIVIAPNPVGDIGWVKATYRSPNGEIGCRWIRENGHFSLEVDIPVNTRAQISLPAPAGSAITESGRPSSQVKEIRSLRWEDGRAIFEISSGRYRFVSAMPTS